MKSGSRACSATAIAARSRSPVFLLSLDDAAGLADHVVVLDDPMTSQDEHRALATAAQIAQLASRAAQVIVLSHDAGFLQRIADHAQTDVVQLELDKARRTLVPWNGDTPGSRCSPQGSCAESPQLPPVGDGARLRQLAEPRLRQRADRRERQPIRREHPRPRP